MTMIVWVVEYVTRDGGGVYGVYATEASAQEVAEHATSVYGTKYVASLWEVQP